MANSLKSTAMAMLKGVSYPAYTTPNSQYRINYKHAGEEERKKNKVTLDALAKGYGAGSYLDSLYGDYSDQYMANADIAQADTQAYAEGLTAGYGSSYIDPSVSQSFNAYRADVGNYLPSILDNAYSADYSDRASKMQQVSALQAEAASKQQMAGNLYNLAVERANNNFNLRNALANNKTNTATTLLGLAQSTSSGRKKGSGGSGGNRTPKIDPGSVNPKSDYPDQYNFYKEAVKTLEAGNFGKDNLPTIDEYIARNGSIAGYTDTLQSIINNMLKLANDKNNYTWNTRPSSTWTKSKTKKSKKK